jgi:hypothetical protein
MPIPDEKARAWTRPEDYWPPRRPRRSGKTTITRFRPPSEPAAEPRPLLEIIPYAALMLGLAVMAVAIIALAWPGRTVSQPAPKSAPVTVEVGTALKGWMDQAEPARR